MNVRQRGLWGWMILSSINPMGHCMAKSQLLCIEGPAGSGKTTLCAALVAYCETNSITQQTVSEFSPTPIGRDLASLLGRFADITIKRESLQALVLCIADKLSAIMALAEQDNAIVILERGFITQSALVIPYIKDSVDATLANALIAAANDWLASRFDVTTFILQLPAEENIRRLEQRLGRSLNNEEQQAMRHEIAAYAELVNHHDSEKLGMSLLDGKAAPQQLAHTLIGELRGFNNKENKHVGNEF